ncbi:DUF3445 domain-containing protein [Comamonadaceae bacterium G21597-S1]|nr:DUF3445 domain-containing protein [Comamonadaceae bacterium G21597-S1]
MMAFDPRQIDVPFRMQPGLRRMHDGEPHLHALRPGSALFDEKRQVHAAGTSIACVPGFDARAAIAAIWAQAARDGLAGVPPDTPLALAFEQDLAVLDLDSGRVPWMCVCVPSGWDPQDKIGRDLLAIHAPVADAAALNQRWPQLLRLLAGDGDWARQVWTISASPLHDRHPRRQPATPWPQTDDPEAFARQCFLRTERQSFFVVPAVDGGPPRQRVFTIRVQLQPLADAVVEPIGAQRLLHALQSMSEAVLAYKQLAPARARLQAWLSRRAAP